MGAQADGTVVYCWLEMSSGATKPQLKNFDGLPRAD